MFLFWLKKPTVDNAVAKVSGDSSLLCEQILWQKVLNVY